MAMTTPSRRTLLAASATALVAAPHIARAQGAQFRWRMITSWTKNLPGPGVSAERLAQRINKMSGGRMLVEIFPAGSIVPAFGVFEAISTGVAEMGHTASFFWDGKLPGAALFTTAPFGLPPLEHQTWIEQRGGQALWDEFYRPHGVRGLLAGNTGPSMGGWFRKPITSLDDINGLRIRVQGLGGEVYRELGATPQSIPPGDIVPALERGAIDAVELLAPVNDLPLGFQRFAPIYHMPGFNKPNGAAEALLSLAAFEKLPGDLREIVETACAAEHMAGLIDAQASNAQAIGELVSMGAKVTPFPADVIAAMRAKTQVVLDRKAAESATAAKIVASYRQAVQAGRNWATIEAYMAQVLRQA
ncbi:MAG: transporter substrate-binding protein [Hyphomicrobiales bacterium]|jgi:TRAP-type mannitol/chloroaromatic compound transport system substrate-binding protein|nr:transporter substrate-binding protein [Hyphomicrobiales bacterium]